MSLRHTWLCDGDCGTEVEMRLVGRLHAPEESIPIVRLGSVVAEACSEDCALLVEMRLGPEWP